LVRMKRDRYVAREAGAAGGSFRTPLVILGGAAMTLNLEAPAGEATVQVLDESGRPLRGFTRAGCPPVSGDALAAPVRWKKPLSALAGQPVRLEFLLKNARLFSFDLEK